MRERPNAGSPAPTERATPWIIAVAACILLAVGVGLAFSDRAASAGAAWGVGFLLVALLLISKFKRFKGFGFEAEMWEQKQAEAAALVDQLKSLSKLISKQMASVAARIGLWDSALSMAELADFLEDLQQQLNEMEVPPDEADEVLEQLYQRIDGAFHTEARHEVSIALRKAADAIHAGQGSADLEERKRAVSMVSDLNAENRVAAALPVASMDALIEFVENSKIIGPKTETIVKLREIDRDVRHFRDRHSFRRKDWLPKVAH